MREHAVSHLTAGRVLHIVCPFTTPPKPKFVVVAVEDPLVLLLVNSQVHPYIAVRPYLSVCQVTVTALEHTFLEHDSYLDCSQPISSMSREAVIVQLVADPARIKGELSPATRAAAADAIGRAVTIPQIEKDRILARL